MAQSNPKRRQAITTAIILGVALIGVLLVTSGRSDEKGMLFAQTGADSLQTAPTTPAYEPMTGTSSAAMSIIKMIAALLVVVVCIYAGIWLLKKLMNKRYTGGRKSYLLEVLETAYIDPKKSLSLVRVADKSVLIGVTDNQISVLTELDTELTRAAMEAASKETSGDSFATMLKSATQKFTGFGKKS